MIRIGMRAICVLCLWKSCFVDQHQFYGKLRQRIGKYNKPHEASQYQVTNKTYNLAVACVYSGWKATLDLAFCLMINHVSILT